HLDQDTYADPNGHAITHEDTVSDVNAHSGADGDEHVCTDQDAHLDSDTYTDRRARQYRILEQQARAVRRWRLCRHLPSHHAWADNGHQLSDREFWRDLPGRIAGQQDCRRCVEQSEDHLRWQYGEGRDGQAGRAVTYVEARSEVASGERRLRCHNGGVG